MYTFVTFLVRILKKIIPEPVVRALRPAYHRALSYVMALSYSFPARKLVVIGVTGTKGKSTVAEMFFSIMRAAGHKTALLSTIRFAIEDRSEQNRYKMTLPGRGFAQSLMRRALDAGCTHFVIEVTSESVLQYRHLYLDLDALMVTNIQKEHIESHGSFENYVAAKREIVLSLARSKKRTHILVANADIPESKELLSLPGVMATGFSVEEMKKLSGDERGVHFTYENTAVSLPIPGAYNALNALGVLKMVEALGIPRETAVSALASLPVVHGRTEHIDAGQDFFVVVDYAHTPDSLRALYSAFPKRKICVLGNTGGGRDAWKRPVMGRIAEESCAKVILTNEDPYDEDPYAIVDAMVEGMSPVGRQAKLQIIMDRRAAIRAAIEAARPGDAVLISGKGTDPYIMGPEGTMEPWNDAYVAREELQGLLAERKAIGRPR